MSDFSFDPSTSPTIAVTPLFSDALHQTFRLQNTIAQNVRLEGGFGFWTGENVNIEFQPAESDSGIVFVRTDMQGCPRIPASIQYREEKPRQTSLVKGSARVDMVEHLLAAVKAHRIDNCEIHVDRPEMPGFDGSSMPFFAALEQVPIIKQPAIRLMRLVTRSFRVGNEEHWINVMPNRIGNNRFQFSLVPDANYPIEEQQFSFDLSSDSFREEIAATRTFLSKQEADYLLSQGLCRRVTPQHVLVLTEDGPLENEYRIENECARHKVLDMVGDFSLCNCDWIGTVESHRGGHALNAECVKRLLENTLLLDESFLPKQSDIMLVMEELRRKAA